MSRYMKSQTYADEFKSMLEEWHRRPEMWDSKLDAEIHRQYAEVLERGWMPDFSVPYFSPSSVNSCPRELYEKVRKSKKDKQYRQPHQGRWTRIGTAWGDVLQRDLLFIDKHWENEVGTSPPFRPVRTDEGFPMWEDFAKVQKFVEHRGHSFSLFGTCDGIIEHADGTRMGLEIKSKQTTSARTSDYSMREPEESHVKQCVAYSIMYGVDKFLIVYGNLSKKKWMMTPEEYEKAPDLRVFEIHISQSMKDGLLGYLSRIMDKVEASDPPPLDLTKWTFNDYKSVIAQSLTDEELTIIRDEVRAVRKSSAPDWKKDAMYEAYVDMMERRDVKE